jgi:hypothetical protein
MVIGMVGVFNNGRIFIRLWLVSTICSLRRAWMDNLFRLCRKYCRNKVFHKHLIIEGVNFIFDEF